MRKWLPVSLLLIHFFGSPSVWAWPPVDVPQDDDIKYFAIVTSRISPDIIEEFRFAFNDVARMELGSDTYFTKHPQNPTVFHQPLPYRVPFLVHIRRVVKGNPVMGWIGHLNNYVFEYFEKTDSGFRCSIRLQIDDDLPPPASERDKPRQVARRNIHLVLENGRWGFSQRMGLNPFMGGNFHPFESVLAVSPLFDAVERSRPTEMGTKGTPPRLADGEEPLWSDENTPVIDRKKDCGINVEWAAAAQMSSQLRPHRRKE